MEFYRARSLKHFWRVFFCLGFGLGWVDGLAQPRIEVDQPVWNFGKITNGGELEHDFVISNAGDASLEIGRVVSSCKVCLQAAVEKDKIPPGGRTLLHSRLNLQELSGAVSRVIGVDCNDPQSPSVVFEISGVAVPVYEVIPDKIELDMTGGQPAARVEILPIFKLNAGLSRVICTNANFAAALAPRPAGGYELNLEARKGFLRGDSDVRVEIRSTDSNDVPCVLNVWVHNPPDLELVPPALTFQPRDEPQTYILWVKQHGSNPVTLLDAVAASANYHCEIDPDADGVDYRIYVTGWQLQASMGMTNSLVLKMRDAKRHDQSALVPLYIKEQ